MLDDETDSLWCKVAEQLSHGGYLDASDAGYITTPGYPLEYPPHQNCRWVITAPEPSQRIVLNFNPHFEIEKLDCRYDYVEIHDGNSESADLLGKHCSNIAPAPIISSGPSLHIKFVSDYAHQGAGFSLRYEIFKTGSDCSRNFTSPTGLIESPGFPDKYPHNLECSFIIIVPPSMDVTLTFLTFDLENDPLPGGEGDCKYDWLEVWDGLPGVGPLIGRYCGTRVPPEIQSSTGILSLSFHTDMAVAKDGFSARYNMTHKEVSETFHCSNAFGMESGKITDDQITASSSFYDEHWLPRQARLNYNDNGWTPNEDSNREYIQVDLHTLKVLTGIATQGAISKETQKAYHVTTFKLEVSTNGEDWMVYRHGKNHKVFHANTDATEVVLNRIPQPVLARFVRIRPQTWKNGIALRFELYGCQITDAPCSELQGMLSGLLPDSQISASSMRDIHGSMGAARLVASRSGWFPNPTQPIAGEEWLQADLGVPKMVRGIITQGARGLEGSTSAENRAFVRKYKLAHSLTGKDWTYITDSKTGFAKIFEGNGHYDTPEVRRFDEIVAQYIRVFPERWSPAGIGMRMEVLGCDLPETTTVPDTVTPTLPREEQTTAAMRPATTPSLSAVCDFEQSLCGWSADPQSGVSWSLHTASSSSTGHGTHGTRQDLALGSDNFSGNYLHLDAGAHTQRKRARLLSPEVVFEGFFDHPTRGHIRIDNIHMSSSIELEQCTQPFPALTPGITRGAMSGMEPTVDTVAVQPVPAYWYYVLAGGGALLLLVTVTVVVILCCHRYHWATKKTSHHHSVMYHNSQHPSQQGHQNCYQNQNLNYNLIHSPNQNHLYPDPRPMDFGKDPVFNPKQPIDGEYVFPGWPSSFSTPSSDVVPPSITVVSEKDKDNAWLYTLDPILLTIIVMSSLGVLLGAVCAGLLLYCTCSYSGLSSRSSTTLENYNFELYDGIKHKVKINQQRCCSEA
ncbi:Neuropilin-2 Vascular endothelial cell growth factor 165 receptor 2 Precursor [Larimichthys crocea]|uniref:Neuropilin-2 Vascular endothelial cell growth factor 165 receptor 2 n=1 Tax=Larimichthys crocea TaxID=215358 RepID=A0A6G0J6W0_LARCR|nr:Neuropilin-2 Vascular endothelial cell growth factor 165 receptor 2 Precursor [Larimichthys crocea]